MENYWDYTELEVEKYYNYFTRDEWQKFSSLNIKLQELHPQRVFDRKKRNLTRTYEGFLSQDASDRFLNSEPVREIILDNIPALEAMREKVLKNCTLDSFQHRLNDLSLNDRKKIRQLCDPSEHFEKRGKFLIRILIPLFLTILFFIIFNLLGVTFQNATDTVFSLFRILVKLICLAVIIVISCFILSYIDFSSNNTKIAAVIFDLLIAAGLFAGCYYLCDRYIRPSQNDYNVLSATMSVALFAVSLLISELSSAPSRVIKRLCNASASLKEDTDSRYHEYLLKDENMEIIAIALYLDDILHPLTDAWLNDNYTQRLQEIRLEMKMLIDTVKNRVNDK
ncbi:MAG: hypothetical protein ACI4D3_05080 [Lachnospiraceae bacterium]